MSKGTQDRLPKEVQEERNSWYATSKGTSWEEEFEKRFVRQTETIDDGEYSYVSGDPNEIKDFIRSREAQIRSEIRERVEGLDGYTLIEDKLVNFSKRGAYITKDNAIQAIEGGKSE